jgi:hypothetical protein
MNPAPRSTDAAAPRARSPHGRVPCTLAVALAALALPAPTRAEEDAYCARVRARAGADAAILYAPRLFTEAYRLPSYTEAVGPTLGDGYQVRIGLALSPIEMLRAARTERLAEADCRLYQVTAGLDLLVGASDEAQLPALRAQQSALEGHRADWNRIVELSRERLRTGLVTLVEVDAVRRAASALERRAEEVRGQVERLAHRQSGRADVPLPVLAASVAERSMELERASARVRALDAFQLRLAGGIMPGWPRSPEQPARYVDWFARVELSYSLGAPWRGAQETASLRAREAELVTSRHELPARIAERQEDLRMQLASAERTRRLLEADANSLRATLATLDAAKTPGSDHARATLALEQYSLEGDLAYVSKLSETLAALVGEGAPPSLLGAR